jgi:hypothetical protein
LPFTGRDAELGLLAAKITDAAAGHGSITLVHGEAGIGKSTLLNRAAHIASTSALRVLHIRCTNDAPNSFGPWEEVFRAVGAADFDAFVRAHGGAVASAVAQAIAARLHEPTTLIVDDVHELTGDAHEIFVALTHAVAPRHAIIAGLRPEGLALARSRLADVESEEILLGRLDRKNLNWALSQALGNEQPEVLDVLYDRSGGHPLFFTGLLNALISEGALARDGHRWQLVKRIDTDLELPDNVRRFIETRLQARGDTPRAVACALAIEPAANADDFVSVLHLEESTVLDALDDLLALGLITQPLAGTQFAFAHDLIREVAALGLNAGRRTVLHRAFAQRLATNGELEASLRLARHFEAAGEFLSAAQSYLKAAEAALELNAVQDAVERCEAGIQSAGRLERTPARDLVLAKLHRTSARAAVAIGDTDDAATRAREAVTVARSAEDDHESVRAILDLSVIEGVAFQTLEQKSDATEAARSAAVCGDGALEAEALVQVASAARHLGQRDEALQAGHSANDLAQRYGRPEVAAAAIEELLRTQITWWQFSDALESARSGLDTARRCGSLVEASLRQVRCALWYLLERFEEAQSELQVSVRLADESIVRRHELQPSPVYSLPVVRFIGHYMAAKIANERKDWEEVMDALERAATLTNVARLPRHAGALSLLRIDVLLRRNLPGDGEAAHELVATLGATSSPQDTAGFSDCVELARARDAARARALNAHDLLHSALNTLEENAHQAPLETDRAFARLASAADEIGEAAVAARARERSRYYESRRRAAAGAAWGGEVHAS